MICLQGFVLEIGFDKFTLSRFFDQLSGFLENLTTLKCLITIDLRCITGGLVKLRLFAVKCSKYFFKRRFRVSDLLEVNKESHKNFFYRTFFMIENIFLMFLCLKQNSMI